MTLHSKFRTVHRLVFIYRTWCLLKSGDLIWLAVNLPCETRITKRVWRIEIILFSKLNKKNKDFNSIEVSSLRGLLFFHICRAPPLFINHRNHKKINSSLFAQLMMQGIMTFCVPASLISKETNWYPQSSRWTQLRNVLLCFLYFHPHSLLLPMALLHASGSRRRGVNFPALFPEGTDVNWI